MPRKNSYGEYVFKDFPEFRPNQSPKDMFLKGSFGGTYWRPIYSSITKTKYNNEHKKFPKSWWNNIPDEWLITPWNKYDKNINKYKVKVGTTLEYWECKKWITKQDPYGWVQWYCHFFQGRRSPDDERQIKRWLGVAGENSRFRKRLINMIKKKNTNYNDFKISPKIRQTLLHWGYELTSKDYNKGIKS